MKNFKAPWGRSLVLISASVTLMCLGSTAFRWLSIWVSLLPLVLVVGCALFSVRGYTVTGDVLMIHRLLWVTRISLHGLQSAEACPNAMRGSLRTFGNGGLFSFTGYYRSRTLGPYRAYVTDFKRTVVLRWAHRTVVLSPEFPEEFVRELPTH